MIFTIRTVAACGRVLALCALTMLPGVTAICPPAIAETVDGLVVDAFDGPVFRKGLWRFDRTLEYPDHRLVVRRQEAIRCVDPTVSMRGTFASPDIGSCRSDRAERNDNRYTFANRCDYLGPVSTDITVHGDDAYTEINTLKTGNFVQADRVAAQRIGDCEEPAAIDEVREVAGGGELSARRKTD